MKKIPTFNSEDEEREFWSDQDSTNYVDRTGARPVVLSNLRPSTKPISLRLPEHMIEELETRSWHESRNAAASVRAPFP